MIKVEPNRLNPQAFTFKRGSHIAQRTQRTKQPQEEEEAEEEEEIYLAQTQQIKCKYKSYTIQLTSRVTGKPEGQLCQQP